MARPSKMTPPVVETICDGIRKGLSYKLAAQRAGVGFDAFNRWRKSNRAFRDQVEVAEAEGAYANIERIDTAAQGDWKAAAWLLERRHPEAYSRKERLELDGKIDTTPAQVIIQNFTWDGRDDEEPDGDEAAATDEADA